MFLSSFSDELIKLAAMRMTLLGTSQTDNWGKERDYMGGSGKFLKHRDKAMRSLGLEPGKKEDEVALAAGAGGALAIPLALRRRRKRREAAARKRSSRVRRIVSRVARRGR